MTVQDLEETIAQIRALPADKQQYAAEIIDVLAAQDDSPLTPDERAGIAKAQASVHSGSYASDADVEAFFAKYRA